MEQLFNCISEQCIVQCQGTCLLVKRSICTTQKNLPIFSRVFGVSAEGIGNFLPWWEGGLIYCLSLTLFCISLVFFSGAVRARLLTDRKSRTLCSLAWKYHFIFCIRTDTIIAVTFHWSEMLYGARLRLGISLQRYFPLEFTLIVLSFKNNVVMICFTKRSPPAHTTVISIPQLSCLCIIIFSSHWIHASYHIITLPEILKYKWYVS